MDADIIIAGSGPSGVSAAFPLIKSGLKVLMVDVGKVSSSPIPKDNYIKNRFRDTNQWKYLIGENYESLDNFIFDNPKQRVARNSYVFSDFNELNSVVTNNFVPVGSLAQGGLSNIWGGTVACFDNNDFLGSSMEKINLKENYTNIINRIGVSGVNNDDLSNYFGNNYSLQSYPKLDSILENVYESIIGAIYLDLGFIYAEKFIKDNFEHIEKNLIAIDDNYKDILLRYTQANYTNLPIYEQISIEGPPHNRTFTIKVIVGEETLGKGTGKTKKDAEQNAAQQACKQFDILKLT